MFPGSLELSKKFLKSCRLNVCLYGKRNSAKSQRYEKILHSLIFALICVAAGRNKPKPNVVVVVSLPPSLHPSFHPFSVMSGSSAPWGKAHGSARCATVPGELSATFSCWSAYEPESECSFEMRWAGEKKLSLDSFVIIVIFFYNTAEEQVRWLPNPYEKEL